MGLRFYRAEGLSHCVVLKIKALRNVCIYYLTQKNNPEYLVTPL